jgi:hypothetical protein
MAYPDQPTRSQTVFAVLLVTLVVAVATCAALALADAASSLI